MLFVRNSAGEGNWDDIAGTASTAGSFDSIKPAMPSQFYRSWQPRRVWMTNAPAGGMFQYGVSNPPEPAAYYGLQYNP